MNTRNTLSFQQSENDFLQLLFQKVQGSLAIIQDGHIQLCTRYFAKMLGYSQEELLFKNMRTVIHPEHEDRMLTYYTTRSPGEEGSQCIECKVVTKSGEILWLNVSSSLVEWDGKPAALDVYADITEFKHAEQELRESEERLGLALDIVNEGIWDWFVETSEAHFNAAWFSMLGYTPSEFPQSLSTWEQLVHPEDFPEAERRIKQHLKDDTPIDILFRMCTKSGGYRWINSKGQVVERDAADQPIRVIGIHLDVTDRIMAERALKESEERFKALHDASSGGIIIHDQGIIIDCNKRISDISGYAIDELIGMNGILLVAEDSRDTVMQMITAEYEKPYDVVGLRKNGEKYPLQVEGRNFSYAGNMVRVVEFRDITEVRRAQEERAVLKARLEALWQVSRMVEADYASLCNMMLREVQLMTASEFAFFGFLDKSNESMTLQAWSPDAKAECSVAESKIVFPIHKSSMWAKAIREQRSVIVNDYENSLESKRELPQGHIPIHRLLMIPLVRNGVVEAMAAVANKANDYTEEDASQISAFVTNVMLLLERRTMEEELKESEKKLSMALEMALMGQWELDLQTLTFTFNEQFYKIYGTSALHEGGMFMSAETYSRNFTHPDEAELVSSEIIKIMNHEYDEERAQLEHRIVRRDGEVRHIVVRFAIITDEFNRPIKTIGVNQDITLHKLAEEEMANQRRRLADIIQGTNVGTWEWNVQTGETVYNERWADIIGYSLAEISPTTSDTWVKCVHPDDLKVSNALLDDHFNGDLDYYECEVRLRHKSGDWVWILDRGKVSTWTADGKPLLMSGTHQDITEKKRDEEKIHHLATHDMLTDLPSLRLAKDRIQVSLATAQRKGVLSAVLFIDLDGFKGVNDQFGHDAGDALLKEIAKRLTQCVRKMDTVARLGGDEFLVILSELQAQKDAAVVAEKIVNTVKAPFMYMNKEIQVGASVGISVCGKSCAEMDIDRFIKQADEAMYYIKKSGKNGYTFTNSC
ncbi:PAS domain S-box protein [Desulfovibrio inopinatus]|uniref:PAS domain S-box protein n=1 Tax=Desulfovibrio inopinatus TaxID=102109 RepID=UPI0003FB29C3|nr:PAS domain S-box protein [Desulfovibrio inopinatus]